MATNPSITQSLDQMTKQMKQLAKSPSAKNLQVSPQAYANWYNAIQTLINGLSGLPAVASLTNYGSVGEWGSAKDTKRNLKKAVTGPGGYQPVLEKAIQHFDECGKAFTAAYRQFQAQDKDKSS